MTPSVYEALAKEINSLFIEKALPFITAEHAKELWMKMLHHQIIDATVLPGEQQDAAHAAGPLKPMPTIQQTQAPVRGRVVESADYKGSVLYMPTIGHVQDFHEKFEHPIASVPNVATPELRALRVRMLLEEVLELAEAARVRCELEVRFNMEKKVWVHGFRVEAYPGEPDMVEMADAIGDIDYLAAGAALVFGFPHCQIIEAIQCSNMSKLGTDGNPVKREDGKIMKGPNYKPPTDDIRALLGVGPC
jgi:predicted HAD superfamily Cof-like phosphohydrolase